jgi:hypothetical protein
MGVQEENLLVRTERGLAARQTHEVRPEGVRGEATNQSHPLRQQSIIEALATPSTRSKSYRIQSTPAWFFVSLLPAAKRQLALSGAGGATFDRHVAGSEGMNDEILEFNSAYSGDGLGHACLGGLN